MKQLVLIILQPMMLLNFKYKAKLLGNTEPDIANGILWNTAIAVLFKYPSNFWGSLEMPLNNCKVVELRLKWTMCYILGSNGPENTDADQGNVTFTIINTKLHIPVVTWAKGNRNLPKLVSKEFERSVYWNEDKWKLKKSE